MAGADAPTGQHLCVGRTIATGTDQPRRSEGDDCLWGILWLLNSHREDGKVNPGLPLEHGMPYDPDRGYTDAYCRRVYANDPGRLVYPPESPDGWGYGGNLPPYFCPTPGPAPSPIPSPSASPGGPPPDGGAHPDVNKLLLLNYGKCQIGKPFVFFLDMDPPCKELLATATPKSSDTCDGKACDSTDPSRQLTWRVTRGGQSWPVGDEDSVDIGCATVKPGPIEMTFNRTIVGRSACTFTLAATYVDSAGHAHDQSVQVSVQ
jgi:hypothetical protein